MDGRMLCPLGEWLATDAEQWEAQRHHKQRDGADVVHALTFERWVAFTSHFRRCQRCWPETPYVPEERYFRTQAATPRLRCVK